MQISETPYSAGWSQMWASAQVHRHTWAIPEPLGHHTMLEIRHRF